MKTIKELINIYIQLEKIEFEINESTKWLDLIDAYGWRLDSEIEHLKSINNNISDAINIIKQCINGSV